MSALAEAVETPGTTLLTPAVHAAAAALPAGRLPAYLYDLAHLRRHVAAVRASLPPQVELYYAAKANAEPPVLEALAGLVDGFDVSSGGELAHVRAHVPQAPVALSGPGKTLEELDQALRAGVERVHVESLHELAVLSHLAAGGTPVPVLLRVNLPVPSAALAGSALAMGGRATPFGLDPADAHEALRRVAAGHGPGVRVLGVHAHLASGLGAAEHLAVAGAVLGWATAAFSRHGLPLAEVNLGGGMAVRYDDPGDRFPWADYGAGLGRLARRHPSVRLRIEPGRSITAYSGWYATEVLDVKTSHGEEFAVLRGGTHHLRTPAAKGHDQPCAVLSADAWPHRWPRPAARQDQVTLVGQLCTPKDVLASHVAVPGGLRAGDRVVFAMAGAYAWNISHHGFLMHPPPSFVFLEP